MAHITLLTDFDDFYVAAMKGVILSETDARITDIYHAVPPQNVRAASFMLANVAPWFPAGTVHCVVVDPSVGTDRRALVVESGDQFFVGPDNGVLIPAAKEVGDPTVYDVPYDAESNTFHGRDVFAPTAARIAEGERSYLGEVIEDYVELSLPEPSFDEGRVKGEVVYVDRFGNAITNIDGNDVLERVSFGSEIAVNGAHIVFEDTYARVERGQPVCTIGSHGNFEVSVNQGSGSKALGLSQGDKVTISFGDL